MTVSCTLLRCWLSVQGKTTICAQVGHTELQIRPFEFAALANKATGDAAPVRVESANRASTTGPAPWPKPQSAKAQQSHKYLWSTVVPNIHTVRSCGRRTAAVVQAIAPAQAWLKSYCVSSRSVCLLHIMHPCCLDVGTFHRL